MTRDLTYILNKTIKNKDCLEWTGCYNTDGYPRLYWNNNSNGKVHRIVYELVNKTDITGKVIRHTCDNPKCINPDHLVVGTSQENTSDRVIRDRSNGLKQKDVCTIKELYASKKYNTLELAAMFNVSRRTIYYSLNER